MTQDFVALLGAFSLLLGAMGGGGAWILTHIEGKAKLFAQSEKDARDALKLRLELEIADLKEAHRRLEKREVIFFKRIYQLEALVRSAPGVSLPTMEGWPPT